VDVIVVYKVDRLTRSLADFAKLVELFDRDGVSFVSVTQQFNTTTSMGRLTLNVRLSFAQFEREVTSERIRDKIAASKRKGLWVGGMAPLGYEIKDRKIVVLEEEAEQLCRAWQPEPIDAAPSGAGDRHQGSIAQDRADDWRPIHPRSPCSSSAQPVLHWGGCLQR
jgi:Resolvase, N terminal domain